MHERIKMARMQRTIIRQSGESRGRLDETPRHFSKASLKTMTAHWFLLNWSFLQASCISISIHVHSLLFLDSRTKSGSAVIIIWNVNNGAWCLVEARARKTEGGHCHANNKRVLLLRVHYLRLQFSSRAGDRGGKLRPARQDQRGFNTKRRKIRSRLSLQQLASRVAGERDRRGVTSRPLWQPRGRLWPPRETTRGNVIRDRMSEEPCPRVN